MIYVNSFIFVVFVFLTWIGVSAGGLTRLSANKRRRIPPNQPVIDCEHVSVDVVGYTLMNF